MTTAQNDLNLDSTAMLDDLFAEIDAQMPAAANVDASDEIDLSELDAISEEAASLEVETNTAVSEQAPSAEVDALESEVERTAADQMNQEVESELNDLDGINLDDLNLDALNLEDELRLAVESQSEDESPVDEVPKEPKAPKQPKVKSPTTARTTYQNAKKSEVLLDRLGGNQDEIVLEFSDIDLSAEELAEKQSEFLKILNIQPHMSTTGVSTQKKVAEKVVILFTYLKRGGKLNEVIYRTIKLLVEEGQITSGDKGNLVKNLLEKPYSIGTARAQSGQMYKMLPMLKIATETSKGVYTANEDSVILRRLRDELFPTQSEEKEVA